jgi:hypothetical protein
MSVYDSEHTDFVFLYNSGSKAVTVYAGNDSAISPDPSTPSILIRFKQNMPVCVLGHIPQGAYVKIKMTQDSDGFMEIISAGDFNVAYRLKNPRTVFKQIVAR